MSILTISGLGKGYGAQTVLDGVTLRVGRGEKVGVVGKNGGGKSTLLKILVGRETADRGSVRVARGVRIGYLSQIAEMNPEHTVRDEALTALSAIQDAEAELREAEHALAEAPDDEDALDAYGAARDRFDFAGGDQAEQNLFGALTAMGFADADLDKPVMVLSGGEKTRLALAKLLASSPDVLALDEPTNHLDIRAVEWLEAFLDRFPGAVLVVSHDRRLLENVAETVWEVEAHGVTTYAGGYASYREQRAAIRARQQEEYERQREEIARTEEFIRRNKAGQNTRIAMGRQKRLDRLERLERPPDDPAKMKAKIQSSGRSGREVVVAERASKRYGERVILDNATFFLERGKRIGIVGPNGVGKTTFIEMVLGEEPTDAGFIRVGFGVTVAYHKQEADDFDPEMSVLENFYERAGMTVAEARSHLARFLFTGDDVYKPVSGLSGGERSKLAMALMVLSPANLLVLDEPTNHLDVYSCEALSEALGRYEGTLLLVSHDRALLDAVTDTTLALEGGGKFTLIEGSYRVYRAARDAAAAALTPGPGALTPRPPRSHNFVVGDPTLRERGSSGKVSAGAIGPGGAPSPPVPPLPQRRERGLGGEGSGSATVAATLTARELSKERTRAAKRVAAVEGQIAALEGRLAAIEAGLSHPNSLDEARRLSTEHAAVSEEITDRMAEWEAATLEAEALGASG